MLSSNDKSELLRLARKTISCFLVNQSRPELETLDITLTPAMEEKMGAFVSLHTKGALRGCIGTIFPKKPLYQEIFEQTINAAFDDPRFPPLRTEELHSVKIEISALMAPTSIENFADIVLGKHGIIMRQDTRQALFLPQVALTHHWTLEKTLDQLAQKAGLRVGSWRTQARFEVFEAIVFGEDS